MFIRDRFKKFNKRYKDHRANIVIETNAKNGMVSKVLIDGRDVSQKICGLKYEHNAHEHPRLTLTLLPKKVTIRALGNVQAYDQDLGPLNPWD